MITGRALPRRDAYRIDEEIVFHDETEVALIASAHVARPARPGQRGRTGAVGRLEDRDLIFAAAGT